MRSISEITALFRKHYDKIIALVVLLMLLGSVVYLAVRVGMIRHMQEQFTREIQAMRPQHEQAQAVDPEPLESARAAIRRPFQTDYATWTNRMLFVPERRVWCVDCRRPIEFAAMQCPFCDARQPQFRHLDPDWDTDKDGIPDLTEKELGLNPLDPRDVFLDSDGDGYINKVEFEAGTDMRDPESFPPPEHELRVVDIDAVPFDLLFKSVIKLPDGTLKFALNLPRVARTYFVKLGESVGGFMVKTFESKTELRPRPGFSKPVETDVSELTLVRGSSTIVLRKGKNLEFSEYRIRLHFDLDDTIIEVSLGERFMLKGRAFEVISVDTSSKDVVLRRLQDNKKIVVRERAGSGQSDAH